MSNGYAIDQCGLYALTSHRKLSDRLGKSVSFIKARARSNDLYKEWPEPKKSGGFRLIEAPRDDLKKLQRRIADLLQRVTPPEFLFSPVKGRSYMDNATAHVHPKEIRLLDINDYFGQCDARSVYTFFNTRLRCEPDVAHTLTCLTTRNGHLPQGSPSSPILSFYSCWPMWEEVSRLVREVGCSITVYVDDITISGSFVPEELIWRTKEVLRRNGHTHNLRKERRRYQTSAEVTGVIVGQGKFCAPHRHYKKLQAARIAGRLEPELEARAREFARARSLESQIQALKRRKTLAGL